MTADAVRIEVEHLTDPLAKPLVLTDADWLSYSIAADMTALASTWEVNLRPSRELLDFFRIPGHKIRIAIDGHTRLRGIVESCPKGTDEEGVDLSIAGRDYGLFLVDNAAPAVTFTQTTMQQVVEALLSPVAAYITRVELDPASNRYRVAGKKGKVGHRSPVHRGISTERKYEQRTKLGDKIGDRIQWLAEQIGCRVWIGAEGQLILARPDYTQPPIYDPLFVRLDDYGNVTASNCKISHGADIGDRYAKIAMVAQGTDKATAIGVDVAEMAESVLDPSESFYRIQGNALTRKLPKADVHPMERANDRKAVVRAVRGRMEDAAAKAAELTIQLDGHRQGEDGALWAIDTTVPVVFDPLRVSAPYYIWKCRLRGDESGRRTELGAIPSGLWYGVDHDAMTDSAYARHCRTLWERYAL